MAIILDKMNKSIGNSLTNLMEEMKNDKLEKPTKIVKIADFVENVNEINHSTNRVIDT